MRCINRLLLALGALVLVLSVLQVPAYAMVRAASAGGETTCADTVRQPRTHAEIRQWYNDQVACIPTLAEQWTAQGLGAEERARRAYDIRHNARLRARAFMRNKDEVKLLQDRDLEKYGNPDGPTFEYLVEKNRNKGLRGDAVYEAIIQSADRTNKAYNRAYGVAPPAGSAR